MDPLFSFLFGHIIGDYALQTDNMAKNKSQNYRLLLFHCLIYVATLGAMSFLHDMFFHSDIFFRVLPWLVPIFVIHLLQDMLKSRFFNGHRQFYYIDQSLHLAAIYALRVIIGG